MSCIVPNMPCNTSRIPLSLRFTNDLNPLSVSSSFSSLSLLELDSSGFGFVLSPAAFPFFSIAVMRSSSWVTFFATITPPNLYIQSRGRVKPHLQTVFSLLFLQRRHYPQRLSQDTYSV